MGQSYNRLPHYLARNHRSSTPSNFLFYDTETKGEPDQGKRGGTRQRLWFGYALAYRLEEGERTRQKECWFTTPQEFWEFFTSRLDASRPLWVLAHNQPFDFTIVDGWYRIERLNLKLNEKVLEGPPFILGWKENGCKATFIDTLNFWRTSLASIGKSIGLPKLEMPQPDAPLTEWHPYCKRDVEVIAKALEDYLRMIRVEDLGSFRSTFPSQAVQAFKHRFMDHLILVHNYKPALDLEREGYHGGLVRNFWLGCLSDKPIYKVDVNSLYPFVMRQKMPLRYVTYTTNDGLKNCRNMLEKYGAIARVELDQTTHTYPHVHGHRLVEADGNFTTVLPGPELVKALERKHVKKILEIAYYEMEPIFLKYVDYFYGMRLKFKKSRDESMETLCKYFLNSLYGKFGQRSPEWREFGKEAILEIYEDHFIICRHLEELLTFIPSKQWGKDDWFIPGIEEPIEYRVLAGQMDVKVREKESRDSCPAIAAYVTSYAREYLRELIAEVRKGEVYYCDTDSLFLDKQGYDELKAKGLISQSELGKLKLEGRACFAAFYGPKDYQFGYEEKTKGIRKNAIELGIGEYLQDQFEGIRSILNRDPEAYVKVMPLKKSLSGKYTKGTVSETGHCTPFRFPLQ